ncbi:hypothetical protein NPIL_294621 [Nephila pilipes]|uniref:Uncharacterized protein n=1 Tax=Nephila pilipes TaxID=299642 RepID=A0A8X6QTW2_NEPPI|nr:hypothetical protein NPIL_294621 [Nephila pilipes]
MKNVFEMSGKIYRLGSFAPTVYTENVASINVHNGSPLYHSEFYGQVIYNNGHKPRVMFSIEAEQAVSCYTCPLIFRIKGKILFE